ncbi:MAG: hypothetical protein KDD56_03675 [Bdellovibrionales bacterium]|nr:hypothetical protein [Bdellovibrionales bacterium]
MLNVNPNPNFSGIENQLRNCTAKVNPEFKLNESSCAGKDSTCKSWSVMGEYHKLRSGVGFEIIKDKEKFVFYVFPTCGSYTEFFELDSLQTTNLDEALARFELYLSFLNSGEILEEYLPFQNIWRKKYGTDKAPEELEDEGSLFIDISCWELKIKNEAIKITENLLLNGITTVKTISIEYKNSTTGFFEKLLIRDGEITSQAEAEFSRPVEYDQRLCEMLNTPFEELTSFSFPSVGEVDSDCVNIKRFKPQLRNHPLKNEMLCLLED